MKKILNKKFLSAIAVLAISGTVAIGATACGGGDDVTGGNNVVEEIVGKTYYASANADANGTGESINSPAPIYTLLNTAGQEKLAPGDTVYVLPGTYKWNSGWKTHSRAGWGIYMTANGTPNGNIKIINAALDAKSGYTGTETKVTIDFSDMTFDGNNRGIQLNSNYTFWYGIDICGAGDNGMYIGGSYNTIEYCDFYNNRDTGLQLGRGDGNLSSVNQWPSFNLIKNCTSHNNYDDEFFGENADGFAAKLTVGYGNVFDGCIAYRNSDDGWDLYAKSESGNIGCVIIYNCVAFENGYLEYTQAESHAKLNYNSAYNEPELNTYLTRDGDGNGFKLGGSVMEGDVKMYNCLAFQNRMHGVTDNSNPGYLQISGVTSYDNSAAIDDNPNSETFGQVISASNHETHGNINVARQTYSYNTVKNTISVKSGIAKSVENDEYRGSVMNSLLNAGSKTNVVKGSIDADTEVANAAQYTSQANALKAEDVFKLLPVVQTTTEEGGETVTSYTYNISGLKDSDNSVANMIHNKYRNEDHSINMGDLLAIKDEFDFSDYFDAGVTAGSVLDKTSWDEYEHFSDPDLLNGVGNEVTARLLRARETLTINSDETAVYQDFEVPTQLTGCKITWTSNSENLKIGKIVEESISSSEYITIGVIRPTDGDKKVTLTATISYHNHSIVKTFELNLKKDVPSIGDITVRVSETDEVYANGGKIIIDAHRQYAEPVLEVANGAYYNGRLLSSDQYTVETSYEFASSTKDTFVPVSTFTPNHPGVFRITHNITLNDGSDSASMSYLLFTASTDADVDFDGAASVSVYRDGYIIAGGLTNVTGTLYAVASDTEISNLTVDNIKDNANVIAKDFRATDISFDYENANSGEYYIYYAIANVDGNITSPLYSAHINTVSITTAQQFMKIAGGSKIGSETVAQTIYMLENDIDFSNVTWSAGSSAFTGVLNGNGHTISGITVSGGNNSIFARISGGTIMNIKFNDIHISGTSARTGIVARTDGGYFHNIAITNLMVRGTSERTGGLIAQVFDGATPTELTQISLVNPVPAAEEIPASGIIEGLDYYITGNGNRVGGLIGLIQPNNPIKNNLVIRVSNCYVETYLQQTSGSGIGGMVAEYDANGQLNNAKMNGYDLILEIDHCVSAGVFYNNGTGRIGGMLGYHKSTGALRVSGCLALQTEYYKNALIETSQKNQSPVIGGSSVADVIVSGCVAFMEEYNTDYEVSAQNAFNLSYISRFEELLDFDTEVKWSYVYLKNADGSNSTTRLAAPYITLNFIED